MLVGIDVAKAELVVAVRPSRAQWTVGNDEHGVRTLVERLRQESPELIVLEATGRYELLCVAAFAVAKLPVVVANPRQAYASASVILRRRPGQLAKTDRIDANILALFAERVRPAVRPLPDAEAQELDALLTRRRQLLEMLGAERNRLGQVFGRGKQTVKKSLKAHVVFLEHQLHSADVGLREAVHDSPAWRERDNLLQSVPGVGPVLSFTLLAELPELGRLSLGDCEARRRRTIEPRFRHHARSPACAGRSCKCAGRALHGRSGGYKA